MDWSSDNQDSIMSVIKQYCEEDSVKYRDLHESIIGAGFQCKVLSYQLYVEAHEKARQVRVLAICPTVVPVEKRSLVAEYLTRANWGLMLGNLEMNCDTGEVRYRTSLDVEGGVLTSKMVKTQVEVNLATMDKYAKGLLGILCAGQTPTEAIAEINATNAVKRLAAQVSLN
jgi:hypothetical protein